MAGTERFACLTAEEHQLLDGFSAAMAENLMSTSQEPYSHVWPAPVVNILEARFYSHSFFLRTMYRLVRELEARGYGDDEIASLWGAPSRILLFLFWIDGKQTLEMPTEDLVALTLRLLRYVRSFRNGDMYCKDGRNLLLPSEMARELAARVKETSAFERIEEARAFAGWLNAALCLYTELLYFAGHSWGHEFHGPYQLAKGKSLVVREYYDLRPEIWEFAPAFPWDRLTTLEVYRGGEIAFDMCNRTRSRSSALSSLVTYTVLAGDAFGKPFKLLSELVDLRAQVSRIAEAAVEAESNLDKRALIRKFTEAAVYCGLRPLAEELGEEWFVPPIIYELIKDDAASESEFLRDKIAGIEGSREIPHDVLLSILRDSFDPRIA